MSNRNITVRRVSGRQLEVLCDFLNSHRDIAVAYNRSLQAKEYSSRKWREIAEILNSQGDGIHKDWKGWSKYWVDYKAKLKRRVAAVRSCQARTGGGPSTEQPLSNIECKFIAILGADFGQGLRGIRVEPFPEPTGSSAAVSGLDVGESPASEIIFLPSASASIPQEHEPEPPVVRQIMLEPPLQHLLNSRHRTRTPSPQPTPAAVARSPRRRRRRRDPLMSQEAARRALVQSSQLRAEAAVASSAALERIAHNVECTNNTLQRIERYI